MREKLRQRIFTGIAVIDPDRALHPQQWTTDDIRDSSIGPQSGHGQAKRRSEVISNASRLTQAGSFGTLMP